MVDEDCEEKNGNEIGCNMISACLWTIDANAVGGGTCSIDPNYSWEMM